MDLSNGITVTKTSGRCYSGLVGLTRGFGCETTNTVDRDQVLAAVASWHSSQMREQRPCLAVVVGATEDILYVLDQPYAERAVRIYGEIASAHDTMSDTDVVTVLQSLFTSLAETLGQTTVRFTYWGDEHSRCSYRIRVNKRAHPEDHQTT